MKKKILTILIILACVVCAGAFSQESVFVRANGNDNNSGLNEAEPVKTLLRAVRIANQNNNITSITVIGTLNSTSEGFASDISVFNLSSAAREIIVTGKPNASRSERAVLSGTGTNRITMVIQNAKIRFEHIEISGGTADNKSGIFIFGDAQITLGPGAIVRNNNLGVLISENGTCILDGGEVRNNSASGITVTNGICNIENGEVRDNAASGVFVGGNGVLTMRGGTIRNNRDGGVVIVQKGRFTMYDGTITGNRSSRLCGGVLVGSGATFNQTGGTINRNTAGSGSNHNVYRQEGSLGSDLITQ